MVRNFVKEIIYGFSRNGILGTSTFYPAKLHYAAKGTVAT